ncbi:DEAD/DEAH box helicase family protein [Thermoflavifilum sp.]|uniref:DEAD/DEAH box helicase family protein n=1 Tax=Thermoflavifilum sp. TaxID=1968839 RepID=UPI0025DFCDFE|nr:DEAD/DEAH box helicase family protein [Thermoflavifilum sp.]
MYRWAGEKSNKITHLDEFAHTFLSKCTLAEMISRYMVLVEVEKKILMMRPYQIYAVKAIMESVRHGSGNGFIWHTTGSGKTLTSFKASTLMKDNPGIDKCLFVVDRKDLDRQTREEFNRFPTRLRGRKTPTTDMLVRRLLSGNNADKVIVTTIQKLGLALDPKNGYTEKLHKLKDKRFVFIFDECHRSQFGEYHRAIKEFFPRAQLFGFTGTPIFEENATYKRIDGTTASFVTTKDVFETLLHAYTITHAIDDRNVLRFHIDYYKPETPCLSTAPSTNKP